MDTAGPGFFHVCGLTVGVMVAFVAFLQGVSWLVERLGRLVGRIASGGLVHTQSDAEAAYTEMRWLAGEGDQDDETCDDEQTWEIETDPRTGRVTVLPPACDADADEDDEGEEDKAASAAFLQGLPPDFLVELDGGLVVTAAEAARWADLRACYQGAAS